MKDYIEREAVIKGFTDLLQKPGDIYPTDITTMMQKVPAADVKHVVTCKDCKYNERAVIDAWGIPAIQCGITNLTHHRDWFCADGEPDDQH